MHLVLYEWMYSIAILLILYQDCLPTWLTHVSAFSQKLVQREIDKYADLNSRM